MTIVVDTGPIVAAANDEDPAHLSVVTFLSDVQEPLVMPMTVAAEIDYLLQQRIAPYANVPFLHDLAAGRYQVECLTGPEYELASQLNARYAALHLGLADLSVIVLAHRFRTRRILTFDQRHFRAVEPLAGGTFTLLPMDLPAGA